jgi:acyl-CoA thioester hydrolase
MEKNKLIHKFDIRWADVDANQHLRHSSYNDYACQARVQVLEAFGLSFKKLSSIKMGPVLFREETRFLNEIGLCERITVSTVLTGLSDDGKKWSFTHRIFKYDGRPAAVVMIEGAWMDLEKRKLTVPPEAVNEKMKMTGERSFLQQEQFAEIEKSG